MALQVGELVLDRYVVEGLVGVGGMGEVYRARHQKLGMPVAIKAITGASSPDLVARFGREAMLLARVRHPNVVSILDVGQTADGSPCLAMEFLEGESLESLLQRRGALPWVNVRAIGMAVLNGLDATHAAGIVHRDLKPANVFITRGNPEGLKLVDFGIAHSTSAEALKFTRTGAMVGTPAYMAPEQLVGGASDARTDVYAVGLLLYELATGRLPFGDDPNAALRRLKEPIPVPTPPPGFAPVPPPGVSAILAALTVEPERRPASAAALYGLLRGRVASEQATSVRAGVAPPPVPRPPPPTHMSATRVDPHAHTGFDASAYAAAPAAPAYASQTGIGISPQGASVRAIVAARIPISRMSREEQKVLAQMASPGRAYHLGGGNWFSVLQAASVEEAADAANRLGLALMERYGDTCKVLLAQASDSFALTPASLSGSAPLPQEIVDLLQQLNPVA